MYLLITLFYLQEDFPIEYKEKTTQVKDVQGKATQTAPADTDKPKMKKEAKKIDLNAKDETGTESLA